MSHVTAVYHIFWSLYRARKRKPFFYLWLIDLNSSNFTLCVGMLPTEEFQARSMQACTQ